MVVVRLAVSVKLGMPSWIAFADGSHWRHIIPRLYQAGHRVMAAQNPLTSLADDIANTRKLAEWMGGPTLLVGHSYGGAVITGAGRATNRRRAQLELRRPLETSSGILGSRRKNPSTFSSAPTC